MSPDKRRPAAITPLYDALCMEFARRELEDDERLAQVIEGWA